MRLMHRVGLTKFRRNYVTGNEPTSFMQACHIGSMLFNMKTTLNMDGSVMQRLRDEAARQMPTASSLSCILRR